MNLTTQELMVASVAKMILGAQDVNLILNPEMYNPGQGAPYSLWVKWDIAVDMMALHVGNTSATDAVLKVMADISEKIMEGEVARLKKELSKAENEVRELMPYKHYAKVAKEINGVK